MKSDKLFILCINQKKSQKKYTITIKSVQIKTMGTVFMNSENSKTFEPQVLILELTDKLDLR